MYNKQIKIFILMAVFFTILTIGLFAMLKNAYRASGMEISENVTMTEEVKEPTGTGFRLIVSENTVSKIGNEKISMSDRANLERLLEDITEKTRNEED